MTKSGITYGDDQEIACPYCGAAQCLGDAVAEGCGSHGFDDAVCADCGKTFEFMCDYSVDVMARRKEGS